MPDPESLRDELQKGYETPSTSLWEAILDRIREATAPRYEVVRLIGYGGMGGVYLADEPKLGRRVAIKVLAPSLLMDPNLVSRFRQEARIIASLSHPHIVTIYDVADADDLHYFVMAYIPGRTVGHVMNETQGPLPIDVVRAWLYQIGSALDFAHDVGVIHRDVKPSNVLLDDRGNALVTDFGIAKVAEGEGLTRTGMLVGTPAYMSPEQCSVGVVGPPSDQYSLGAVAYEMITGQVPFSGPTLQVLQAHVNETPRSMREVRPDTPPEMAYAVDRMLAKAPQDRWPSLGKALEAMGARPVAQDAPVRRFLTALAAPATPLPPAPGRVRPGAPSDSGSVAGAGPRLRTTTPSGRPTAATVADGSKRVVALVGSLIVASAVLAAVTYFALAGRDDGSVVPPDGDVASGSPEATPPPSPTGAGTPGPAPADTIGSEPSTEGVGAGPELSAPTEPAQEEAEVRQEPGPEDRVPAAPPPDPPPATPQEGVVQFAGLPAGARVTVTVGGEEISAGTGDAVALPAGRYEARVEAPGFETFSGSITVTAGQTLDWRPAVEPAATPPEEEPERPDPSDPVLREQAEHEVGQALAAFARSFETRDMDEVLRFFPGAPGDWAASWRGLVENRQNVRDLRVRVDDLDMTDFQAPDIADVVFTIRLEYRDLRNTTQSSVVTFEAVLERRETGWSFQQLRQAS